MPKKQSSFGKGQSNPTAKQTTPMVTPSLKPPSLPENIKAPHSIAAMPKLTRPAKLAPRKPSI